MGTETLHSVQAKMKILISICSSLTEVDIQNFFKAKLWKILDHIIHFLFLPL